MNGCCFCLSSGYGGAAKDSVGQVGANDHHGIDGATKHQKLSFSSQYEARSPGYPPLRSMPPVTTAATERPWLSCCSTTTSSMVTAVVIPTLNRGSNPNSTAIRSSSFYMFSPRNSQRPFSSFKSKLNIASKSRRMPPPATEV